MKSSLCEERIRLFLKVVDCVVVANILNDLTDGFNVIRILAALDQLAELGAEDATEILMARVRKEGAAIRQHSHKLGDQPEVQKVIKNAVLWAKPTYRAPLECPHVKKITL